jgi:hypothetical protein
VSVDQGPVGRPEIAVCAQPSRHAVDPALPSRLRQLSVIKSLWLQPAQRARLERGDLGVEQVDRFTIKARPWWPSVCTSKRRF